jgi:hypothetical protein
MEPLQAMNDLEIQEKVESLAGKGTRVLDCEKSTSFQTEEVLLVNGFPVPLAGEEGARIKAALLSGQVPPGDLLNEILIRAGILKNPVELEATVNVKTTTKTTEVMTLRDKNGLLLDERMKEVEEDNEFSSTSKEVWKKDGKEVVGGLPVDNLEDNFAKINLLNGGDSNSSLNSSNSTNAATTPKSQLKFVGHSSSSSHPLPHLQLSNGNVGGGGGILPPLFSHSPQSSSSSSGISEGSCRSESSASSSRFSVRKLYYIKEQVILKMRN